MQFASGISAELAQLPVRAQLAVVTRYCARLKLPSLGPHAVAALVNAATTGSHDNLGRIKELVDREALDGEEKLKLQEHVDYGEWGAAVNVWRCLGYAIESAIQHLKGNFVEATILTQKSLAELAESCYGATGTTTSWQTEETFAPIRHDIQMAQALALAEHWTDDTPVHPVVLGEPWSGDGDDPAGLMVEFEVPDSVSDADVSDAVEQFADLIDDVHRAYGGRGLRVRSVEVFSDVACPVGGPA